jgi:hypothetical protein
VKKGLPVIGVIVRSGRGLMDGCNAKDTTVRQVIHSTGTE